MKLAVRIVSPCYRLNPRIRVAHPDPQHYQRLARCTQTRPRCGTPVRLKPKRIHFYKTRPQTHFGHHLCCCFLLHDYYTIYNTTTTFFSIPFFIGVKQHNYKITLLHYYKITNNTYNDSFSHYTTTKPPV